MRAIHLTARSGQTAALDCAFRACRGEYIITLDGDGQNDPHDIPALISLISSCDLVTGIRTQRQDSFIKRLISKAANTVRRAILKDATQDTGCSLKIMKRQTLDKIKLYRGMHRFLPALFQIEGGITKEVPVNHRPRRMGTSKYSLFSRGPSLILDLIAVRWMKQKQLRYDIDHDA